MAAQKPHPPCGGDGATQWVKRESRDVTSVTTPRARMMRGVDITPPHSSALRESGLDAAWLAQRIEENPILLGITTGMPVFERAIPDHGGDGLAVLLFDPTDGVRHIVDVQLGEADEDQVIRALDFWATERHRMPSDHRVAVVAEHIPGRVARAAALARTIAPIDTIELRTERMGSIVALHGEPIDTPSATDPRAEIAFALRLRDFLARLDEADPLRGRIVGPPPATLG